MENNGFVHLYCGDGKGKTTAAVGLALRCAGSGGRVLFVQFFKDGTSSELEPLRRSGIDTLCCEAPHKLFSLMNEDEKECASEDYTALFLKAIERGGEYDVLVLDEIVSACTKGVVDEKLLTSYIAARPKGQELVLTGRKPSEALLGAADYVTEMKKIKHPYDKGCTARKGIEF
ncbi:MAG: cob(I)yrinic acid a,c-diamide adenosyltransferase [Eubacteriales bacterium]|nr:cob(I)yrinic acid a,c-diamide adenosyltransferase [Eubacteriales bacterium]